MKRWHTIGAAALAPVLRAALAVHARWLRDFALAASALQPAIRHPERVSTRVLVVRISWKPGDVADSAPPVADETDERLLRLPGSRFLFRSGLQSARDQAVRHSLATPPEPVHAASPAGKARCRAGRGR